MRCLWRRLTCGLARCPDRSPAAARPARPLAVRAASFARRVGSKPGQAPPPPTGTAAGPSGALHTSGALSLTCCWLLCLEARPGPAAAHRHRGQARWTFRRPPAPRLCPPDLPAPSIPAVLALRGVARCVDSLSGQAPPPTSTAACPAAPSGALHFCLGNFARNSPAGTSNHEVASLQLQRYWAVFKSDRRKLCATFV